MLLDTWQITKFSRYANDSIGTVSNELYHTSNIALLCENIINGMMAANEYRGNRSSDPSIPVVPRRQSSQIDRAAVNIILDIDHHDWDFRVQAGEIMTPSQSEMTYMDRCTSPRYYEPVRELPKVYDFRVHISAAEDTGTTRKPFSVPRVPSYSTRSH
jgi:hypothetical protein